MSDLEVRLRARYAVTDERLDAFAAAVSARIRTRRRVRLAAAVLLPLLAAAAGLVAAPAPEPGRAPPVLVLARDGVERSSDYAPPGVGQLVAESDVALFAKVLSVDEEHVRLEVEEVLFAPPGFSPGPVPAKSRDLGSCSRILTWTEGEEVLLFLWRDPERGRYEVRHGGSGKVELPHGPLDRATLRAAVTERTVPVPLVADAIRRAGPTALFALASAVWSPRGGRLPVDAAPVQDALAAWLADHPDRRKHAGGAVQAALRHLTPDRLAALPDAIRADLVAAARQPENLYTAFSHLEPLARAGLPEVRPALDDWWRRVEAKTPSLDANATVIRLVAEGLAARARLAPDAALPELWALHDARPIVGLLDRGDVLELLLPLDTARATEAVLALTKARLAAGYGPPLPLLAATPGEAAADAIRRTLLDPDWDPASIGHGKDLRDSFLAPDAPARPGRFRATILERLATVDDGPAGVATLVELLAATPERIDAALPRIRAALRRTDAAPEDVAALLRAVQEVRGERWLAYVSPTPAEVEAARRQALRALGD